MKRNNHSIKDMVINRITSFPYNKAIYYDRLDIMIFTMQFVFDFYSDKQRVEKHKNAKKLFNMVRRYVINYLNDSDIKRMHKGHDCFTYVTNEYEIVYICKPHRELSKHVKVNYALAIRNDKLKDKCR